MNLTIHEASLYVHKLAGLVKVHRNVEVVLAPTALALQTLSLQVEQRQFKLAAQNFYWRDEGAYTGEIAAHQLNGLVEYALVGHSERRHIFGEHDKDVRSKVQAAIRNHITPILCVGETAHERAQKETPHVLHDQVVGGLANITSEEAATMVIAYEPVWALSNGKDFANHPTPTPKDIESAVATIRNNVAHLFGKETAAKVRVLYGGSVSSSNTAAILAVPGIDGLLIGGASLKAKEFSAMVELAHEYSDTKKTVRKAT